MAIATYRFDGNKQPGYKTANITLPDAYEVTRTIWNYKYTADISFCIIDLTDEEVAYQRQWYVFTSTSDVPPPPPPPTGVVYQDVSQKGQPNGYPGLDSTGKVPSTQLPDSTGGGGTTVSDASTTVKGVTKLTVAPSSATNPIALGDNDPRVIADQIAGTASIRTLGTGAQQAASGSHTHSVATLGSGTPSAGKYLDGNNTWTALPTVTNANTSNLQFNVKDYGAKGDAKALTNSSMTAGQATLIDSTALFSAADQGKSVYVIGAGSFVTPNGTTTTQSNIITGLSSTTGVIPGSYVSGTGIPAGTYITSTSGTSLMMNRAATASGTVAVTISQNLSTTISQYVSATQVTLANAAQTSVSSALTYYGTSATSEDGARNAAFTAASNAGGGIVIYPPGMYFTESNGLPPSNVMIQGSGRQQTTICRVAGITAFQWQGTQGTTVNLNADAPVGSITLSVPTATIKPGQYLELRHTQTTGSTSGSNEGEMVLVQSVNGSSSVTLVAPIVGGPYLISKTARVNPMTMVQSPQISDMGFTSIGVLSTNETVGYISFKYCESPLANNLAFEKTDQYTIEINASVHASVINPYMRDMLFAPSVYLGYGILMRGPAQWLTVLGARCRNHQVFNNGGNSEGFPRFAYVQFSASQGDPGLGTQKAAVSTHSDGEHFTIDADVHAWNDFAIFLKGNNHTVKARISDVVGAGMQMQADTRTLTTVTSSADVFTKANHQLKDNDPVSFSALTGGTGLTVGATYYAINADNVAGTFKIAASIGSTSITPSTNVTSGTLLHHIIPRNNTVIIEKATEIKRYPDGTEDGTCVWASGVGHTIIVRDCRNIDGSVVRLNYGTVGQPNYNHVVRVDRAENWGRVGTDKRAVSLGLPVTDTDILSVNAMNSPRQVIGFAAGTGNARTIIRNLTTRNTGPVVTSAESWALPASSLYNVKADYGAVADGVTDDSAVIQSAVNGVAAAGGGILYFPAGIYAINASVTVPANVQILGAGENATIFKRTAGVQIFRFYGTLGTAVALTADATVSSPTQTITLASTTGRTVGEQINIYDTTVGSTGITGTSYGEIVTIKSVDSGTQLTLNAPLSRAYSSTVGAAINPVNWLESPVISDCGFTQSAQMTTNTSFGYVTFFYCRNGGISNCSFTNIDQFGVAYEGCIGTTGSNLKFVEGFYDSTHLSIGALLRGASQNVSLTGLSARNVRCFHAQGGTYGTPKWCSVEGRATGYPSGSTGQVAAFSFQADTQNISLDANVRRWGDIGLILKGTEHSIDITAHTVVGAAVWAQATSATIYPTKCRIKLRDVRNITSGTGLNTLDGRALQLCGADHDVIVDKIESTAGHGIRITTSGSEPAPTNNTIVGGVIRNYGTASTSNSGISLGSTVTNTIIKDMLLIGRNAGERPIRFDGTSSTNTGCIIQDVRWRNSGDLTTAESWALYSVVPPGGTTGQVLSKTSNTDGDYTWATASGSGGASDFINLTASPYSISVSGTRAANTAALVQAFQDAASSATAGGKRLYLPGNSSAYPFNTISPSYPGKLVGDGMGSTRLDFAGTAGLKLSAFNILSPGGGTDPNRQALSVQLNKGDTVLTGIASTTGWASGDWILVRATANPGGFWPNTNSNAMRGEFVRIRSVDSATQVTVWSPLEDTYTTAMTCFATKVTFWRSAGVEGCTFENSAPLTGSGSLTVDMLTFRGIENLHMSAVETLRGDGAGVVLDACREFEVFVYPTDHADQSASSRWGYGAVLWNGNQDGTLTVHARRCRHAITTGAAWMGITRHITVRGTAHECTGASWDTHAEGEDILFDNCHAINPSPNGYSDSAAFGFQIRMPKCKIKGGIASQVYGWAVYTLASATGLEITGLSIEDVYSHALESSADAVWLRGSQSVMKDVNIINPGGGMGVNLDADGLTVQNVQTRRTTGSGGSSMAATSSATGALVRDCVARGGYSATFVSGTTTGVTEFNNVTLA